MITKIPVIDVTKIPVEGQPSSTFRSGANYVWGAFASTIPLMNAFADEANALAVEVSAKAETVANQAFTGGYSQAYLNEKLNKKRAILDSYSKDEIDGMTPIDTVITTVKLAGAEAIEGLINIVSSTDPFGDSSLLVKYELDGDSTDTLGLNNGVATNLTYGLGKFGTSGKFNGSSSTLDTSISITSSVQSYSMHVKFDSLKDGQIILYKTEPNSTYGAGFILYTTGGKIAIEEKNGGSGTSGFVSQVSLQTNKYYHIVLERSSIEDKIIIDGNIESGSQIYVDSSSDVKIGYINAVGLRFITPSYLEAEVSQIEFYNRTLTPEEIITLSIQTITPLGNVLNYTNAGLPYANGLNQDGTVNKLSEFIPSGSISFAGVVDGFVHVAKKYGLAEYEFTHSKPRFYFPYNKISVDDNSPVLVNNEWYSTIGGELVPNGKKFINTNGWQTSGATVTVIDETLVLTSTVGYGRAFIDINTPIGSLIEGRLEVTVPTGTGRADIVGDTPLFTVSFNNTFPGFFDFKFIADSEVTRISFQDQSNAVGRAVTLKLVSLYKKEATLGIKYQTPLSWFPKPIRVDNETPQYIDEDATPLSANVVNSLEVIGGLDLGREWKNLTDSKSEGIIYTNRTGKDIEIKVEIHNDGSSGSAGGYLYVDGFNVDYQYGSGAYMSVVLSATIPPRSEYSWSANAGYYRAYHELGKDKN